MSALEIKFIGKSLSVVQKWRQMETQFNIMVFRM